MGVVSIIYQRSTNMAHRALMAWGRRGMAALLQIGRQAVYLRNDGSLNFIDPRRISFSIDDAVMRRMTMSRCGLAEFS